MLAALTPETDTEIKGEPAGKYRERPRNHRGPQGSYHRQYRQHECTGQQWATGEIDKHSPDSTGRRNTASLFRS